MSHLKEISLFHFDSEDFEREINVWHACKQCDQIRLFFPILVTNFKLLQNCEHVSDIWQNYEPTLANFYCFKLTYFDK